jgi:hypothetical protein
MAENNVDISDAKSGLIKLLGDSDDRARSNAENALKIASGNVNAIPELTPFINSSDLVVQRYACWTALSIHSNSCLISEIPNMLDSQIQPEVSKLLESETEEDKFIFKYVLCTHAELKTIASIVIRHAGLVSSDRSYTDKFSSSNFYPMASKKLSKDMVISGKLSEVLTPNLISSLDTMFTDTEAYILERIILSGHGLGEILPAMLAFIGGRNDSLIDSIEKAIGALANISESKKTGYIDSFALILQENIEKDYLRAASVEALFKIYSHLEYSLRNLAVNERIGQLESADPRLQEVAKESLLAMVVENNPFKGVVVSYLINNIGHKKPSAMLSISMIEGIIDYIDKESINELSSCLRDNIDGKFLREECLSLLSTIYSSISRDEKVTTINQKLKQLNSADSELQDQARLFLVDVVKGDASFRKQIFSYLIGNIKERNNIADLSISMLTTVTGYIDKETVNELSSCLRDNIGKEFLLEECLSMLSTIYSSTKGSEKENTVRQKIEQLDSTNPILQDSAKLFLIDLITEKSSPLKKMIIKSLINSVRERTYSGKLSISMIAETIKAITSKKYLEKVADVLSDNLDLDPLGSMKALDEISSHLPESLKSKLKQKVEPFKASDEKEVRRLAFKISAIESNTRRIGGLFLSPFHSQREVVVAHPVEDGVILTPRAKRL